MIKTQEDFIIKIFYLSLYCKGSKRVTRVLRVRGCWRPNRNFSILTSTLMAVNVVSFSFFWCSTGALRSTLLGAGFLYCLLSASSLDPNSSGPQVPSALCGFPYHICLHLNWPSDSTGNWTGTGTQLSYIIVRRPLDLWNRMFNRHQAEITVMQFRGYSLPVHHSVVAQWNLHLVPYYQP